MTEFHPGETYLSREGKIFGPFSPGEIDQFRKSGELLHYAWIWNPSSSRWSLLHPEPPAPAAKPAPKPAQATPRPTDRAIQAICYDTIHLIGGRVESFDSEGAAILCPSDFRDLGPFRKGQKVSINLIDEASGASENVDALVETSAREDRGLRYRFRWKIRPQMMA